MHIWIDNTQLTDAQDLNAAMDMARDHADSTGRLIVDILVDGQPAPDEIFDEEPEGFGNISELRFTTADTNALIVEAAQTAIESIELLRADHDAGSKQIRSGDIPDAMETIRSILEGWQAMRDIVDHITQIANIDPKTLKVGDQLGSEIIDSLLKLLSEVGETLQNEDWSSLGDVIEYDLNELTVKWSAMLSALIVAVKSS
ncbi:MAG: hypothetical protein JKY43_04910 [Phycisphaerales bacterium]|nr:hypothetical protein [Phycisphaerales bacterium]